MILRVFDVEMTGLPGEEKTTAIIQVGWTDVDFDEVNRSVRTVGEPVQHFCNPFRANPSLEMEIGAQATHHIDREDLVDATAPDQALMLLVGGADAFACHNKEHDGHYFTGAGKPFACTLKAAQNVWPDMERYSNQYLRYALKLPVDRKLADPAHWAGPDSYVTAHLLAAILNEGAELSDLIEWSRLPVLQTTCRFGNKHRGTKWDDVPTEYLTWMRDKATDLDRDTKHTLRFQLEKRGLT